MGVLCTFLSNASLNVELYQSKVFFLQLNKFYSLFPIKNIIIFLPKHKGKGYQRVVPKEFYKPSINSIKLMDNELIQ